MCSLPLNNENLRLAGTEHQRERDRLARGEMRPSANALKPRWRSYVVAVFVRAPTGSRSDRCSTALFGTAAQAIDDAYLPSVCCGRDMPVTAKLSREFYDRFGDKIVDELVGLLNDVDTIFKAELREQNDRNLALFDAKLEQRLAELRAELVKWMFLFWLGTVATMLGLGRLLLGA